MLAAIRMLAVAGIVTATGATAPAHAVAATRQAARAAAPAKKVLPFIANDYAKAVAEARARKVPLFIESWAPW